MSSQINNLNPSLYFSVLYNGDAVSEDMAARFVSMVPVTPSQGMFDVWLTCDVCFSFLFVFF